MSKFREQFPKDKMSSDDYIAKKEGYTEALIWIKSEIEYDPAIDVLKLVEKELQEIENE